MDNYFLNIGLFFDGITSVQQNQEYDNNNIIVIFEG